MEALTPSTPVFGWHCQQPRKASSDGSAVQLDQVQTQHEHVQDTTPTVCSKHAALALRRFKQGEADPYYQEWRPKLSLDILQLRNKTFNELSLKSKADLSVAAPTPLMDGGPCHM